VWRSEVDSELSNKMSHDSFDVFVDRRGFELEQEFPFLQPSQITKLLVREWRALRSNQPNYTSLEMTMRAKETENEFSSGITTPFSFSNDFEMALPFPLDDGLLSPSLGLGFDVAASFDRFPNIITEPTPLVYQAEATVEAAVQKLHSYICTTGKVMFGKTELFVIGSGDNLGEFYKNNPEVKLAIKNFGGIVKFCSKYPAFLKYFILETKASKKHMIQAMSVGAKVEPFLDEGKISLESSNIAENLFRFLQENNARYHMLRFSEVAAFYVTCPNAKDIIYQAGGLSRFVTSHYELFRHVTEYKSGVMQYGLCIVGQSSFFNNADAGVEDAGVDTYDESLSTKAEQTMRAEKLTMEIERDTSGTEVSGDKRSLSSPSGLAGDTIPEEEKAAIRADMKRYLSKQSGNSMRIDRHNIILY